MELLIVGAIGYLGYRMSRSGKPEDDVDDGEIDGYPAQAEDAYAPTPALLAADQALKRQRWRAALDPRVSGIITPHTNPETQRGPMPFFGKKAHAVQNSNDAVKQRRLETFTGTNGLEDSESGTWRHKREVPNMFDPKQSAGMVTSGGAIGSAGFDTTAQADRTFVPGKFNNVLPTAQVRVGPGVGVGPDVISTDGFHPMYRRLPNPDELGSYRRNTLPGGVNHGASYVQKAEAAAGVAKNRPDKLEWDMGKRPLEAVGGVATGQTARSYIPRPLKNKAVYEEDYRGGVMRSGQALGGGAADATRTKDRTKFFTQSNVTSAGTGQAPYAARTYDDSRMAKLDRDARFPTGMESGTARARTAPGGTVMPETLRGLTAPVAHGGMQIAGKASRFRDAPKTTLRELDRPVPVINPGTLVGATAMENAQRAGLGRTSKRGDQLFSHTPGHNQTMSWTGRDTYGGVAVRSDEHASFVQSHGALPAKSADLQNLGGLTSTLNKLPAGNPRIDFGIAQTVMRDNPYNQDILVPRRA
jgi:hypothetical protein